MKKVNTYSAQYKIIQPRENNLNPQSFAQSFANKNPNQNPNRKNYQQIGKNLKIT